MLDVITRRGDLELTLQIGAEILVTEVTTLIGTGQNISVKGLFSVQT